MAALLNIVLLEDDNAPGKVVAHRPDCPTVDLHRSCGRPLVTLIGVATPKLTDLKRHSCLTPEGA